MNKEYILKKISPYLTTRRQLREQDFHHLFALLSRRQQYKVVDILIDAGIDLVNDVNTGSATAEESGEQQKTNIVPLLDNS
ncbi:MAG TPA: hypothetical protein VFD65_02705, partial [Chitinophagales bacterium]|nr:hypothetical protein [Chitinophagales bacterium]